MSSSNQHRRVVTDGGITRRHLLGGAIAGTITLAGLPTPATGSEIPVTPLSQPQLDRHLLAVDSDSDATELHRALAADGWRRNRRQAVAHRATEGEPYDVVAIPYHHDDHDGDTILLWSDHEAFPTQVRRIDTSEPVGARMYAIVPGHDGLQTMSARLSPQLSFLLCSRINWTCVLSIAGAWAGTFATCGTCFFDPSRLTCLGCLGAVLSATSATMGCSICGR